jgi:plasmid stabilization system protein ParE
VAKRYHLSPEAQQDLKDIKAYYLLHAGAGVARRVTGEITRAFQFLAGAPEAGHVREDLTDEPVKFWQVFSYLIIYDPASRPVGVARVLHASQDLETLLRKHPPRV